MFDKAIEVLRAEREKIEEEKNRSISVFDANIHAIDEAIKKLLGKDPMPLFLPSVAKKYERKKESLRKAVVRVLKSSKRFLHITEILKYLQSEGNWDHISKDQISRTLTGLKSGDNEYMLVNKTKGLTANTFWGIESYLDVYGEIKREHMYDESLLIDKVNRLGDDKQ